MYTVHVRVDLSGGLVIATREVVSLRASASLCVATRQLLANESVLIQLTQCWFPGLTISNAKIYFFQIKYSETILTSRSRKLLCFEITKMLIALKIILLCYLL